MNIVSPVRFRPGTSYDGTPFSEHRGFYLWGPEAAARDIDLPLRVY